jgi:hypothetical protein
MSNWTSGELDALEAATELHITTRRPDGTLRPSVPIWVVRAGEDICVRSYKGRGGSWFRHASAEGTAHISVAGIDRDVTVSPAGAAPRAAIDEAYRAKYARYGPSYVEAMVAGAAADATLRLIPVN